MKALIVIAALIVLAFVLRAVEYFTSSKIKSVGAKSNTKSKDMAKIDINDEKALKEALDYYKNLTD